MAAALPSSLNVALKEWSTVCNALSTGRQIILLRKGGILEAIGGFELEHPQFVMFPTFLHQSLPQLKAEAHAGFAPHSAEPEKITLSIAGQVTDIIQLKSRAQMDELDDQHIWTGDLIDMRFNYRPANPLYLLLVRAYVLKAPTTIDNTPAYAGCKSWVPLDEAVETTGATTVLDDTAYQTKRQLIRARLEGASTGF